MRPLRLGDSCRAGRFLRGEDRLGPRLTGRVGHVRWRLGKPSGAADERSMNGLDGWSRWSWRSVGGAEGGGQVDGLAVPLDGDLDGVAGLVGTDGGRQVRAGLDLLVVDPDDHVASLDAGLLGAAAGGHV